MKVTTCEKNEKETKKKETKRKSQFLPELSVEKKKNSLSPLTTCW